MNIYSHKSLLKIVLGFWLIKLLCFEEYLTHLKRKIFNMKKQLIFKTLAY